MRGVRHSVRAIVAFDLLEPEGGGVLVEVVSSSICGAENAAVLPIHRAAGPLGFGDRSRHVVDDAHERETAGVAPA